MGIGIFPLSKSLTMEIIVSQVGVGTPTRLPHSLQIHSPNIAGITFDRVIPVFGVRLR